MESTDIQDERFQLVPSKYANFMIAYKPTDADQYFLFRRSKTRTAPDGTKTESYRCRCCELAKGEGFISTTFFRNGRMVREPDVHKAECRPMTRLEIEALKLRREMKRRCREGEDPRTVYEMVLAESETIFESSDDAQALRDAIGSFESLRHFLHRNATLVRDEEYIQLSTRERRRRSAIAAGKKRRAARAVQGSYATEGMIDQLGDDAPAAVVWIQSGTPVAQSPVRRQNISRMTNISGTPRLITYGAMTDDGSFAHEHDYNSSQINSADATGTAASIIAADMSGLRQQPGKKCGRVQSSQPISASYSATTSSPGTSVGDIVKVMEACRKKTRWESFGDYVAKTLESIPEEAAAKVVREMQEIIFRVQDETWSKKD